MPKRIYLIRHGETKYNKEKKVQGWADAELNETGIKQAKKLAKKFENAHFDTLFSSDLKRASKTAKEIAKTLKKQYKETKHLREQSMGIMENKSWESADKKTKDIWKQLVESWEDKNKSNWKVEKGESIEDMYKRADQLFQNLSENHKDETVALFTHGGMKNRILEFLGLKPYRNYIEFGNTSVTILKKTKDKYVIEILDDTDHLE